MKKILLIVLCSLFVTFCSCSLFGNNPTDDTKQSETKKKTSSTEWTERY